MSEGVKPGSHPSLNPTPFGRDGMIATMINDGDLLRAVPDFISIGAMLKASPATEGGRRVIYFEASNEGVDQQNESVAAKALADSKDFYLRYGNVDIDHLTLLGPKLGIPDYQSYEIGRPIDVGQSGTKTFVKAEIYSGSGPAADKANMFWSSITDLTPPARWYPSVAGAVLEKAIDVDSATGIRKAIVKKVRWSNVGVSKTPVNQHVPTLATVPVGVFAKCMTAGGLDIAKALEAGYGTDSATLTGGGALRKESLYGKPINYFDFRHRLSAAMSAGECGKSPVAKDLVKFATNRFGVSKDEAAEHVERFLRDISTGLKQRRHAP